ncbi:hypothetical protein Leryth_011707 [Lithospermum erythrorhizon]|nr:hypothetical protein Leryth_011707 [Lithospermum erythrorhizon]
MLKHKFIEKCKSNASVMLPKIERAKDARETLALEASNVLPETDLPSDEIGGTVPSKRYDADLHAGDVPRTVKRFDEQRPLEGDFWNCNCSMTERLIPSAVGRISTNADNGNTGGPSISGVEGKSSHPWAGDTIKANIPAIQVPGISSVASADQSAKGTSTFQATVGASASSKSETVSRKALDKLWSIYSAGNTVPIPFLRATDISPIALLSENVLGGWQRDHSGNIAVEAMQELFAGDAQSKKGRTRQNEVPVPLSVYQRLASSPTLMNLTQALAYHKMCYEEMPLQEMQATQEQQTIQNLSDTLRTILRL